MDKIKVIVIDDEPRCVMGLVETLSQKADFEVVASSHSPATAIELVQKMQPDVLFLDVEMPQVSGFEVLKQLRGTVSESMMVVFYTAFDKYLIDALRASAFDFLLKPYQPEELEKVLAHIRERMVELRGKQSLGLDGIDGLDGMEGLSDSLKTIDNLMPHRTALQTVSGLLLVNPSEVFSFTFSDDTRMWLLRLTNGQEHKLKRQTNAKQILAISDSFVQVRQDAIINMDYLLGIENYTLRCIFAPPFDKEEILVSRRCFKGVKEKLEIL